MAIHDLERTETRASYGEKVRVIKDQIGRGETYQVNFTLKYRFGFEGSSVTLYRALRERQRVEFGAFARLPDVHILSFSPELFVRKEGRWLTCKPMKGTAPRGLSRENDARLLAAMRADPKTLAENVMIADLIRSDLGRIAEVGSVTAGPLFDVETFETVHQMVSTVRGQIGAGVGLADVLAGVFPCGSITGAPKIRTMQIIRALEREPRGIYTGALGFVAPNQDFCFSVPIRTVVARGQRAEMGIGSGIVDESDEDAEFEECLLKARFLVGVNASFRLLESLRFDASDRTVARIEEHATRLAKSAAHFEFAFDRSRVLDAIAAATAACADGLHKVRVTLSQDGTVAVSTEPLGAPADASVVPGEAKAVPWVALSERRVDSSSCFQRHKTTRRSLYDQEFREWAARGAYDVLFLNERDEVVEASRHNIFIEKSGRVVTPPLDAGALPGIMRRSVLGDAAWNASEETISVADLYAAKRIWLTNSVRGIVVVAMRSR